MAKRRITEPVEVIELPLGGIEDGPDRIEHLRGLLQIANTVVDNSIKARDARGLFKSIRNSFSTRHASDLQAIQLCYEANRRWKEMEFDGGDFLDYARDETGKGVETIRRYSQIGKMMNEVVPEKYRDTLWCRPIRNLVAIAQAVDKHGNFEEDEWHQLSRCVNGQEVRLKLDEFLAKERKPTNRLTILIDRDGGLAAVKKNKREPIGMLRLEPENELIAEAVQRIIAAAGILEQ